MGHAIACFTPSQSRDYCSIFTHMDQYVSVTPEEATHARDGVIKLHGPEGFAGMRKAGRLAAEILDALVPQPPKDPQKQQQPNDRTIVVQVINVPGHTPSYKINETDVNKADLLPRLTDIYSNRAERIMFVRGDDNVNFAYVAEVIDIGKAAGVDHIGLMTPKIMAGQ